MVYAVTKIKPAVTSSKDHHDYKWHCNFNLTLLYLTIYLEKISLLVVAYHFMIE